MAVLKEAAMQGRLRRTVSSRRASSVLWALAVVVAFGSLFGSPSVVAASAGQLRSEGSIIGQVTDESGAVLPGVTVLAKSPALQLESVTAVTDVNGEYRITPLPIGTYTVEFTLSGFRTLRHDDIRLTVGFTARVDVVLTVGAVEESVTVTGQSPLIDTTVAATATQVTKENLENIPTGRNGYIGLMQFAPGTRPPLDVGGSTNNANPSFRAFGQSDQAWQTIDGVMTSNPRIGDSGNYFDFTAFQEATVETVGHDASIGARGVAVNTVIKSGGNETHGSVFAGGTSSTFESEPEGGSAGGGNLKLREDFNGDIGGKIIANKLWYWFGARYQRNEVNVLDCLKPDGSPCVQTNQSTFITPKLTYQINDNHRMSAFAMLNHRDDVEAMTALIPWEARRHQTSEWSTPTNGATKVDWTGLRGTALTWNTMLGYFWNKSGSFSDPDNENLTHKRDRTTGRRLGLNDRVGERTGEGRVHFKTVVNYFARQGNSSHNLKVGMDYFDIAGNRKNIGRGPANDYRLDYNDNFTVANRIFVWNYPVSPNINIKYFAGYVADDWTISRRLTLNLGLRYAYDKGYEGESCRSDGTGPGAVVYPAQCFGETEMNAFSTFSPRLRAVYDLSGDGRSVIKGGWGRYYNTRETDDLFMVAQNYLGSTVFRWRDRDGDLEWDFGESNLDVNGSDFISRESAGATGALQNAVVNPDEKAPRTDEFLLQYEQQLVTGLAVRGTFIYSLATDQYRLLNVLRPYEAFNIPITNPDPGEDGEVGTGDDPGTTVTYFDYADELAGLEFQRPTLFNDPLADRNYKSMEFALSKRLSNNWQFQASYSATRIDEPFPTAYEEALLDPNHEIFTGNQTWEWGARMSGSYQFPHRIMVSSNFEHRSGDPWARTFEFEGGTNVPSLETRVEPLGTRRLSHINLLDVRFQKGFAMGGGELQLRANVFNLLNTQVETDVNALSGPDFGVVLARVLPRIVAFEAQFRF
jgi:outer membrane receptor protein involved in Fe transport